MGALITRYDSHLEDRRWLNMYPGKDSPVVDESDLPPSEFDEEEIAERAAQAEEAELWADLELEAGTHDVFSLTEILETGTQATRDEDIDMS